ncbi:MAG: hypothetical protein QF685_02305 [Verrucomicrobiota bacterium]|nr:hypothetical protein [Verrucomicrobiota bacterium]
MQVVILCGSQGTRLPKETEHHPKSGMSIRVNYVRACAQIDHLAREDQLMLHSHSGFWQCMDTQRGQ